MDSFHRTGRNPGIVEIISGEVLTQIAADSTPHKNRK